MRPTKRELHELPYTEIVFLGLVDSPPDKKGNVLCWVGCRYQKVGLEEVFLHLCQTDSATDEVGDIVNTNRYIGATNIRHFQGTMARKMPDSNLNRLPQRSIVL